MDLNLWVMSKSLMCPFDKMIKEGKSLKAKSVRDLKNYLGQKNNLIL